jgi:hypothetical protein
MVDETGAGSCPMAGFGINTVESMHSTNKVKVLKY